MLIPTVISPRVLVREGGEFDGEREVSCMCGKQVALAACMLTWADLGDGFGYRAICSQFCYVLAFKEGNA